MALIIPSYPNPHDPDNPLVNAYAWLAELRLDLFTGQGQIVFNIHPHEAAWQSKPVDQLGIALGQVLGPGPEGGPAATFPTLAEFMTRLGFGQAYTTIGAELYAEARAKHPLLAGATEV
jgi:hypothetical protein